MHLALAEYNFQYNVRSGDFIFIAFYFVLSKRELRLTYSRQFLTQSTVYATTFLAA